MRESLSEVDVPPRSATRGRRAAASAVGLAVVLSAVLAVVAIIDQASTHSLTDHATALYAPHGKQADPNLLYGLLYTVAAVGAVLWLLVLGALRAGRRSARVLAVVVIAVTAALAALLLGSTEYGEQIFPPLWGVLAILPPAAATLAVVLSRRQPRA